MSWDRLSAAVHAARHDGAPASYHLLKSGAIGDAAYYRAAAEACGLIFLDGPVLPLDPEKTLFFAIAEEDKAILVHLPAEVLGGRAVIAPALDRIASMTSHVNAFPDVALRVALTTPQVLNRTRVALRETVRRRVRHDPALLLRLATMPPDEAGLLVVEARRDGLDPLVLAVRRGRVDEAVLATKMARLHGLPVQGVDSRGLVALRHPGRESAVPVGLDGTVSEAVLPTMAGLARLDQRMAAPMRDARPAVVTTRAALEEAWRRAHALPDLRDALTRLIRLDHRFSAAGVFAWPVRTLATVLVFALAGLAAAWALPVLAVANGGIAGLLLLLAAIRIAVLQGLDRLADPVVPRLADRDLPGYAVLVPLYHEASSIKGLLGALRALDYPAEKLAIKLIVEADDRETREALAAQPPGPPFDIVVVPAAEPRTKPKALAFALPYAEGDIVTIFDAEDRPEPDQLRRVAERFAAAPPDLGCIQARLAIDHPADTWFTRHFALEYATLFDALLPWLSRHGIVFPLGGTSNHIRRAALETAGDWDPHNVTEDADLGFRLARKGWRLETIASTTWEEAPLGFAGWLPQRTRWHKGWLQTWFVHMRRPLRLYRDLGFKGFAAFQLMIGGGLLVLALHFAFFASILVHSVAAVFGMPVALPSAFASGAFFAVFVLGYGAALLLARAAGRRRGLKVTLPVLFTLPVYWLLMGVALLNAVRELVRRPGHWAKTAHGLASRPGRNSFTD